MISVEKKELYQRFLLLLVALSLIFASAFAWFAFNKRNEGSLPVISSSNVGALSSSLFKLTYDKNNNLILEEPVYNVYIENYVPGQQVFYRLDLINNDTKNIVSAINFKNINADYSVAEGKPQPDIKLADVVELKEVYAENFSNETTPIFVNDCFLSSFLQGDNKDASVVSALTIKGGQTASVYFSFKLSENANNYYQFKSLKIDTIQVVS